MGKHLEQALPSVYTLQCLTGKVDNNHHDEECCYADQEIKLISETAPILINSPNFFSPFTFDGKIRQTLFPPKIPAIRYLTDLSTILVFVYKNCVIFSEFQHIDGSARWLTSFSYNHTPHAGILPSTGHC